MHNTTACHLRGFWQPLDVLKVLEMSSSPSSNCWLCTLQDPSDLRCPSLPLQQTKRLVGRLVEILPENHAQYSLALHLLEALEALTTED